MKEITRRAFIKSTAILVIGMPIVASASEVTLQWNAVAEASGYKIYWGPDSRFLNSVSDTATSGLFYQGTAVVDSGTYRIDTDPPNRVMQIVTITTPTVILSPLDVLDNTMGTLTLGPGYYYFAVTAYNEYGESGYSSEVSAEITNPKPGNINGMKVVDFRVPPAPGEDKFTNFKLKIEGLRDV